MIVQSTEENEINNITFTVHKDELDKAKEITQHVSDVLGGKGIKVDPNVAKISIVGVGMISKPGIAAMMFDALGDNNINIKLISTSEIKISCAINREDAKPALKILHEKFELDT